MEGPLDLRWNRDNKLNPPLPAGLAGRVAGLACNFVPAVTVGSAGAGVPGATTELGGATGILFAGAVPAKEGVTGTLGGAGGGGAIGLDATRCGTGGGLP